MTTVNNVTGPSIGQVTSLKRSKPRPAPSTAAAS